MIQLNTPYKLENGDHVIFTEGKKGTINGKHSEATLTGTIEGNVLKATFHNTKVNASGLMEITFHENGFNAKWKSGLEPGPMKGKWNGVLVNQNENEIQNSEEREIVIEVSGRIPKYFFGTVKEIYQKELSEVIEYCSDELDSEEAFLKMLLLMTLDDRDTAREDFFCYIEKEDLEDNFPNLNQLINDIEDEQYDHLMLYDILFETADYWEGGTGFISFFESDASIRILIDNEQKVDEQKLSTFFESKEVGNTEEGPSSPIVESFLQENSENWGISDSLSFSKNEIGCFLIDDWFLPPALDELSEFKNNVTIEHDDIITYTFTIYTNEFRFEDLVFLGHSNYSDFRKSAEETHFSFLFYKNQVVLPDESLERSKSISLSYKPKKENLSFLLNG